MTKKANIFLRSGQTVTTTIADHVSVEDVVNILGILKQKTLNTADGVFIIADIAAIKILEASE